VVVATLCALFAACGKKSNTNTSGGTTTLGTVAPNLPDAIKAAGELKIGSDIEYAPNEFFKEGTEVAQGFDVDLGNALANALGVKAKFINDTDFAGIIGAMNSGRF